METFVVRLGDEGEALKNVLTWDELVQILGNVDLKNVTWTVDARLEIAYKYIPSGLSDSLKLILTHALRAVITSCDAHRVRLGKRIQIKYIDMLSDNDWYYVLIGYVGCEGVDKKTALALFDELTEEQIPTPIARRIKDLQTFIQENWIEHEYN